MSADDEAVAVAVRRAGRTAYHLVVDGNPACNIHQKPGHEFEVVARDSVPELECCTHCNHDAQYAGGQGSTLAAKLAAADPDEVSGR